MADTDLPNAYGAIKPAPKPRPRPIASPFGMLPTDGLTPQPGPPPGFNVQPDTPAQTNPMDTLASLRPVGNRTWADTLGAPVDAIARALRKAEGADLKRQVLWRQRLQPRDLAAVNRRGRLARVSPFGSQHLRNAFGQPAEYFSRPTAVPPRRPGFSLGEQHGWAPTPPLNKTSMCSCP